MFSPSLPKDPHLLLSMVNMKLRNEFDSLEDLVHYYHIERQELVNTLTLHGYHYDDSKNQFLLK